MATSTPTVAVFAPHRHPRLRYVLREVGRLLGYRFVLTTEEGKWSGADAGAKVVLGSGAVAGNELTLPLHPFLSGRAPTAADLTVERVGELVTFFMTPTGADFFSCIFFALSRYEEYGDVVTDAHDRFPAAASHAARNGYLRRPVVRAWAAHLGEQLRRHFPRLPAPTVPPWSVELTYDIDLLWAFRYRGWRGVASGLRDALTGHPGRALHRLRATDATDPFQTLPWLADLHHRSNTHSSHPRPRQKYFWLLSNTPDRHDTNPYPIPAAQQDWMRRLADAGHVIGVHPSYQSYRDPALIRTEYDRLTAILGRAPGHARQHFLRLRLPDTYRHLRTAGITHDHSMGYAADVGWRAGTNLPFYWYDLDKEQATSLLVHPFAAMDATLKDYLGLDPAAAVDLVLELAQNAQYYGGPFPLLWHNSSFSPDYGWAGWRAAYVDLLKRLLAL